MPARTLYLFVCLLLCASAVFGQDAIDSLKGNYDKARSDQERKASIVWFTRMRIPNDSVTLQRLFLLMGYMQKRGDTLNATYMKLIIAAKLDNVGDYYSSVQMSLECLPVFERMQDGGAVLWTEHFIGNALEDGFDFSQAIVHMRRALALAYQMQDSVQISLIMNDLGSTFAKAQLPDSGLVYAQQAANINESLHDTKDLGFSLGTLAENYIARGEFDLALPFLRKSINIGNQLSTDLIVTYGYNDETEAFLGLHELDSAERCARVSLAMSSKDKLMVEVQKSYDKLYRIYKKKNKQDSADHYLLLATIAKDSLYNIQKAQGLLALTFREEARQADLKAQREKADEQRKLYIQFSLLALGIIALLITILLLSQSVIINEKWVSFLSTLGLLVVFEFINLLLHPALDSLTEGSPVLMLVALVAIASLLIPLHHRLEHRIKDKMVAKNKRIRLTAAKRTVERLEGELNA
jgi:hypothetical protein